MAKGWSEAPADVLWEIIKRLPLADYIRFGAVCVQWRSALAEKRRPPAPQSPWLMLPVNGTGTSSSLRFFSLSERMEYVMDLPMLRARWCLLSSEGCLIFIDEVAQLHILDPISGAIAHLPSITTLPNIFGVYRDRDGQIIGVYRDRDGQISYNSQF